CSGRFNAPPTTLVARYRLRSVITFFPRSEHDLIGFSACPTPAGGRVVSSSIECQPIKPSDGSTDGRCAVTYTDLVAPPPSTTWILTRGKPWKYQGVHHDVITERTGADDPYSIGVITHWAGAERTGAWGNTSCDLIEGSDGTIFPAGAVREGKPLYIYSHDMCRRVPIQFKGTVENLGISMLVKSRIQLNVMLQRSSFISQSARLKKEKLILPIAWMEYVNVPKQRWPNCNFSYNSLLKSRNCHY
ncbi:unnamed protein product, partial [Nesidiocoris tenuis]